MTLVVPPELPFRNKELKLCTTAVEGEQREHGKPKCCGSTLTEISVRGLNDKMALGTTITHGAGGNLSRGNRSDRVVRVLRNRLSGFLSLRSTDII